MFCIAEADPRWVEMCGQCRGYLKTVDEHRLPGAERIIALAEAMATLYLDLLAEKEGCTTAPPYSALQ
jgi:formate dehydrogenase maturation protein FdhE